MLPVPEIRKGHDALPTHAEHLPHHQFGVVHGLQGLGKYDAIEGIVGKTGESRFQVHLDDVYAISQAGDHVGRRDLDAVTTRTTLLSQLPEQRTVTATQVEHPRSLGYP